MSLSETNRCDNIWCVIFDTRNVDGDFLKKITVRLTAIIATYAVLFSLVAVPVQAVESVKSVGLPAATTPCSFTPETTAVDLAESSTAAVDSGPVVANPACAAVAGWQRTCSATGKVYSRNIWVNFKSGTNPCKGAYLVLRRNDGKMNRVVDTRTYKSLNEWCGKRPFDCAVATGGFFFIAGLLIGPWNS